MSAEKTDAVVIRLADFSETSKVVTLFSRDFGKLSTLAKGAKRLRGPFEAALDLLATCRVVFLRKHSASLHILTEAQLIARFRPAERSLPALYGGYYIAELLAGLTEELDPHPNLFDAARTALEQLGESADIRIPVMQFEIAILHEIGQLPSLDDCIVCQQPLDRHPAAHDVFNYWVSQGGLICPNCRTRDYANTQIHFDTIHFLRRLATADSHPHPGESFTPRQHREARHVMTSTVSHVLERRPKMLRYLQF